MKQLWEGMKAFFERDWTPAEKILVIVCCMLIGIIKGFFWAPIKKGISCGNNNGNIYHQPEEEYWLDDED